MTDDTLARLEAGRGTYTPAAHLSQAENAAGEIAAAAGRARQAQKALQAATTAEERAMAVAAQNEAREAAQRAAQVPGALDEIQAMAPNFSSDIEALLGLLR